MPLHGSVLSCHFLGLSWQHLHTVCLALNPKLIEEIHLAVVGKNNISLWMRTIGMGGDEF